MIRSNANLPSNCVSPRLARALLKYLTSVCSLQPQVSPAWVMPRRSQALESSLCGSNWRCAKVAQVVECGKWASANVGMHVCERMLLHAARSVALKSHEASKWPWLQTLLKRRLYNDVVVAAVANKLARAIWVVLAKEVLANGGGH